MSSTFFANATHTDIGPRSSFQNVEGDIHHNYNGCPTCQEQEEDRVMPKQKRYREIFEGDVFLQEETWSQEMKVVIKKPLSDDRSSRNTEATRITVVKRFYTATLYENNRTVTVVSFEPKVKKDSETTRLLWSQLYEVYSAHRSLRLVQMLGLMRAEMPTFILYGELVNGDKFIDRYDRDGLAYKYLLYTNEAAISALRADKSLRISVSNGWGDWTFDLKTRSWHYDASASNKQMEQYFGYTPIPLPEGPLPQLDDNSITTCFENTFDLSDYAPNGRLTFGAVINRWKRGILAHFPSTPRPEWLFENRSRNIDVCYSERVPSRVDFQFRNPHNTQLNLHFSLRLPLNSEKDSSFETYFIDEIGLVVTGKFSRNPTTCFAPAYLFIPPLDAEYIDGMYCIPHPLPYPLFCWSWDPKGKTVVSKEDWEQAGIPKLDVKTWLGSSWDEYSVVASHLRKKEYAVNGKQYAQDHGYPELIWGDPRDRRIEELEDTGSD
ncbi:hypothetical protein PQX77_021362 [Marasmius sp. AFHP31]|nr:hypothetical protein PQX77_021362 [Marasmius sp. AFHP31]